MKLSPQLLQLPCRTAIHPNHGRFEHGGRLYEAVTNGIVLAATKRPNCTLPEIDQAAAIGNLLVKPSEMFPKRGRFTADEMDRFLQPHEANSCQYCAGRGLTVECDRCIGTCLEEDGFTPCSKCAGCGTFPAPHEARDKDACSVCNGTGLGIDPVLVFGFRLDRAYLRLLFEGMDVGDEFSFHFSSTARSCAFRWPKGFALLMPLNQMIVEARDRFPRAA